MTCIWDNMSQKERKRLKKGILTHCYVHRFPPFTEIYSKLIFPRYCTHLHLWDNSWFVMCRSGLLLIKIPVFHFLMHLTDKPYPIFAIDFPRSNHIHKSWLVFTELPHYWSLKTKAQHRPIQNTLERVCEYENEVVSNDNDESLMTISIQAQTAVFFGLVWQRAHTGDHVLRVWEWQTDEAGAEPSGDTVDAI